MSPRTYVLIVAAVLFLVGLGLLGSGTSAEARGQYTTSVETVDCGSVLSPVEQDNPHARSACSSAFGAKRGIGYGLVGVGVLAAVGGAFVRTNRRDAGRVWLPGLYTRLSGWFGSRA